MEGYAAQLPRRADAAADCLDEMHRLVQADGFRIAAVVGRAESELTAEDRSGWPGFAEAAWFPALPAGAGMLLGSGCVGHEQMGLVISSTGSMLGMVVDQAPAELPAGLTCAAIDAKRWMVSGSVPEADGAYAAVRRKLKGSIEGYLEAAAPGDPRVAGLDAVGRRFREVYELLNRAGRGPAPLVVACGPMLLKSPAWSQRIANVLGVPVTLCSEPEPVCRGAALWALERISGVADRPASWARYLHLLKTKI